MGNPLVEGLQNMQGIPGLPAACMWRACMQALLKSNACGDFLLHAAFLLMMPSAVSVPELTLDGITLHAKDYSGTIQKMHSVECISCPCRPPTKSPTSGWVWNGTDVDSSGRGAAAPVLREI